MIQESFAVINADDYYGKEAFVNIHEILVNEAADNHNCMTGSILKNTLSENGAVTRGICQIDASGYLLKIAEASDVEKAVAGVQTGEVKLDVNVTVSMIMWGQWII